MSEIDRFCIAQHGVPIDHCLSVRTYALPDCHRIGGAEGERSSCGSSTHIWRQQADDLETVGRLRQLRLWVGWSPPDVWCWRLWAGAGGRQLPGESRLCVRPGGLARTR